MTNLYKMIKHRPNHVLLCVLHYADCQQWHWQFLVFWFFLLRVLTTLEGIVNCPTVSQWLLLEGYGSTWTEPLEYLYCFLLNNLPLTLLQRMVFLYVEFTKFRLGPIHNLFDKLYLLKTGLKNADHMAYDFVVFC